MTKMTKMTWVSSSTRSYQTEMAFMYDTAILQPLSLNFWISFWMLLSWAPPLSLIISWISFWNITALPLNLSKIFLDVIVTGSSADRDGADVRCCATFCHRPQWTWPVTGKYHSLLKILLSILMIFKIFEISHQVLHIWLVCFFTSRFICVCNDQPFFPVVFVFVFVTTTFLSSFVCLWRFCPGCDHPTSLLLWRGNLAAW